MPSSLSISKQTGFSLIELALVLAIVGLVSGGLAFPLAAQITQKHVQETQEKLQATTEALVGYAVLNGHLPCPDSNGDGLADTSCNDSALSNSNVVLGDVPWATLGLPFQSDAWNNRLRYAVGADLTCNFSKLNGSGTPSNTCNFSTQPSSTRLGIDCTANTAGGVPLLPGCSKANGTGESANVATYVAFLVFSYGKNAYGAVSQDGTITYPAPTSPDELKNMHTVSVAANLQRRFVYRTATNNTSQVGEFDDQMQWVSVNTLAAKLLAAGQWPLP